MNQQSFLNKVKTSILWRAHYHLTPYFYSIKYRKAFEELPVYAMFIGYPRSGHSLVGAILDAHPNVVMAHELNVLRYLEKGENRDLIFGRLIAKSRLFHQVDAKWEGYSYAIPDQYQGKFQELKVIGDKKGGSTTRLLNNNIHLLNRLNEFGKKLKLIHVIRNPFDNIATRALKIYGTSNNITPEKLNTVVEQHLDDIKTIKKLKLNQDLDIFDLKSEQLIQQPEFVISKLCDFLHIDPDPQFLESCQMIIFDKPNITRYKIEWTDLLKIKISSAIKETSFLNDYSYSSQENNNLKQN